VLVHPLRVIAMRPVPVHLPDEVLEPACRAMGLPSPSDLPPAVRAAINAQVHAQREPNPRVRRAPRVLARPVNQASLGFDDQCVDIKRRAANDHDEE